jgi:hypothetical protein
VNFVCGEETFLIGLAVALLLFAPRIRGGTNARERWLGAPERRMSAKCGSNWERVYGEEKRREERKLSLSTDSLSVWLSLPR